MRLKIALAIGLAASAIAATATAAYPGPDEIGEFYVYFDDSGNVVGRAAMDCEGNLTSSGRRTDNYSVGYAYCNPR